VSSPDLAHRQTSLYRFYDGAGTLLYVGITAKGRGRWHQHKGDKEWWALVADAKVEHFPDRETALDAEAQAIRSERPVYNVAHNGEVRRARHGRTTKARSRAEIELVCAECGTPIGVGDGYIEVPISEGYREWRSYHRRCDPDVDSSSYWIASERIVTMRQLLDWDRHLNGKRWLGRTNWADVFDGVLDGRQAPPMRRVERLGES
jgi:hypothetical protein